uniref:Major sperm protein n=1 Tax=Panagrellus redivivus TaxID=6233 RepID=A0A7E4ZY61_PANRE
MAPSSPVKHDRLSMLTADRRRILDNILSDVQKAVNLNKIYPSDLLDLSDRKWWPLAFFKAHKEDVHVTSAVIQECLRWRKANNIHDLRLIEFIPRSGMLKIYLRGKDVYDNPILWIMMSDHDPADRSIDRLLIFWLEMNLVHNSLAPMTVILNLTGCKAMDLTFVKFMLHTFKYWYPGSLGELILYNVPQRLTASTHIIQTVVANYEFCMAHELYEPHQIRAFVREDTLPESMGGTDAFTIHDLGIDERISAKLGATEMTAGLSSVSANGSVQVDSSTDIASTTTSGRVSIDDVISAKRSVHFNEYLDKPIMANSTAINGCSRTSSVRKQNLPNAVRAIIDQRKAADAEEWFDAGFVAITPKECLILKQIADGIDPVDVFVIKNTSTTGLQFKIKTTSPEKFRVRPSVGFVSAGETSVVRIYLQNGYQTTLKTERFLFMGLQTTNEDPDAFVTTWKQAPAEEKLEKTFNCVADASVGEPVAHHLEGSTPLQSRSSVDLENLELRRKIAELGQRQLIIICMLLFLLIVTFISVVQFRSAVDTLKDALDDVHHAAKKASRHSDL